LPLKFSLFLGRVIGCCLYFFDFKHRAISYSNIRQAFAGELSPAEISAMNKKFYKNFGQNVIEVFLIPIVKKKYFNKYITVDGKEHTYEAFKQGKGVILAAFHAGNWELSNIVCANLGFSFSLFVREQQLVRLNELLNSLRCAQGYKIIQRGNQVRGLVEALKKNEAVGMTVDQGGKTGELVKFFGKEASMATGAVKLALKYGAVILPAYYTRINGPYQKVIIGEAFPINQEKSVKENLQRLVSVFEKIIRQYPHEYYWPYKIWKYTKEKNILILSDGKAGHLRQSQAVAVIVKKTLEAWGVKTSLELLQIEFKNKFSRHLLACTGCLSGKYSCKGCLWCLRNSLQNNTYQALLRQKPDIVISCGAGLAAVNRLLAKESLAKSIVLMKPSILSTKKFDLVIMPRHDQPPKRKNVLITEGALNLIDENYLREEAKEMKNFISPGLQTAAIYIGLLIGGDTKKFHLNPQAVKGIVRQVKSIAEGNNAAILATTSRRTSPAIENMLKSELKNFPLCHSLITANEKNPSFSVGGILGLSEIIVVSPESISMVSEASTSGKYVVVFDDADLDRKHRRFLKYFAEKKYIYLIKPQELEEQIAYLRLNKPKINVLNDRELITEAIKKIL
jgi:lauroyl/myristoyl acyltransferase